jgi:hypothetical protein
MKPSFTGKGIPLLLMYLSALAIFSVTPARADQGDPPSRVARISSTEGSVSLQPGGTGDWGNAARNRPVTIGDKLWSDKDSRVELQAGQAAIHMGSDTALSFLNLDQNITQMRLSEGSVNFRVRELREGDLYEVDTPNLAFTVHQAGAFRIDANENGDSSSVTVIRGEGEVTAGGKTYALHAGERGEFNGTDEIQYSIDGAPGPDGLDRWASQRDLKEDNAVSARYVSRDIAGYDDLDDYGDWRDVPQYGHVWYPRSVAPGWAPYSTGYWSWVGPWGWTWVDESPWGFAPYHYGRWSYVGGGWGWCPGPIYAQPVYGPAFVGFLGGSGWDVGVGFGGGIGVGWFPLGYGEPYRPWYRNSGNYIRNVNVSNTYINNTTIINTTNINNYNYAYAHNVNAVTATSHNAFVGGQPVNRGEAHLTAASLRGAQVNTKFSASPTRGSYFGSENAGNRVAMPPAAVMNRPVVARTAPASAASHLPVRTVNTSALAPGRTGGTSANPSASSQNGPGNSRAAISGNAGSAGRAPVTQSQTLPGADGRGRGQDLNRPPSAVPNAGHPTTASPSFGGTRNTPNNAPTSNNAPRSNNSPNNPRTWSAQGNATDHGQAPQGAGRPNSSPNTVPAPGSVSSNRPPWAGTSRSDISPNSTASPRSGNSSNYNSRPASNDSANAPNGNRSYAPPQRTAPVYDNGRPANNGNSNAPNGNRSYAPPQRSAPAYDNSRGSANAPSGNRSYAPPQRSAPAYDNNRGYSAPPSYSQPSRSYSPPARSDSAPRSYSAPSRGYSVPSQNYSAPSRGYSAPPSHGSGGGAGGGGSPRGGGGSDNHSHR